MAPKALVKGTEKMVMQSIKSTPYTAGKKKQATRPIPGKEDDEWWWWW
jgi:hypothetical protein